MCYWEVFTGTRAKLIKLFINLCTVVIFKMNQIVEEVDRFSMGREVFAHPGEGETNEICDVAEFSAARYME